MADENLAFPIDDENRRSLWKRSYLLLESGKADISGLDSYWLDALNYDVDLELFQSSIPDFSMPEVVSRSSYGFSFKEKFREWIFLRQRGVCGYCGKRLSLHSANNCSIDHMHPQSKGGSDLPPNLLLACWECNSAKRDKTVEEFRHMIMTRQSPAYGIIPRRQIEALQVAGIDMQMPKRHKFVFEWLDWAHVRSHPL